MGGAPSSVVIVIPAYNEERTVGSVVAELRGLGLPVIVVNDASTDNTGNEARRAGACVVDLLVNLGAWGATQCGMRKALAQGYSTVVTCDADRQHDPRSVLELVAYQRTSQADLVIGSCIQRASGARKFAWQVFRYVTGLHVQDLTSGLRLYSSQALAVLSATAGTFMDYQDVGVLLLVRSRGLRIVETPVSMCQRQHGHSRIFRNWLVVLEYLVLTMLISIGGNRFTVNKGLW